MWEGHLRGGALVPIPDAELPADLVVGKVVVIVIRGGIRGGSLGGCCVIVPPDPKQSLTITRRTIRNQPGSRAGWRSSRQTASLWEMYQPGPSSSCRRRKAASTPPKLSSLSSLAVVFVVTVMVVVADLQESLASNHQERPPVLFVAKSIPLPCVSAQTGC